MNLCIFGGDHVTFQTPAISKQMMLHPAPILTFSSINFQKGI